MLIRTVGCILIGLHVEAYLPIKNAASHVYPFKFVFSEKNV